MDEKSILNLINDYDETQWSKLREFVKKHYGENHILQDKKFFHWQFFENPYKPKNFSPFKVMSSGGRILGHLGFIPVETKVFDSVCRKGCILVNLMLEESCRAFGLGAYLVKSAMKEFSLMWATGYTPRTGPMYKKMGGWQELGYLNRYIKIIDNKRVGELIGEKIEAAITLENKESAKVEISSMEEIPNEFNNFWQKISYKYPITVNRNTEYLNWRYVRHPYFRYQILVARQKGLFFGYLIFRINQSRGGNERYITGHIVDLIADDEAISPLLMAMEKKMREYKVQLIDYYGAGKSYEKFFTARGYKNNTENPYDKIPARFNPIDRKINNLNFLVYYNGMSERKNDLCNINNWHIVKGDGDSDRPNP